MKSEPIPEDDDSGVTTVVGKNFDDVVMQSGKDVLVEFYAPWWCVGCSQHWTLRVWTTLSIAHSRLVSHSFPDVCPPSNPQRPLQDAGAQVGGARQQGQGRRLDCDCQGRRHGQRLSARVCRHGLPHHLLEGRQRQDAREVPGRPRSRGTLEDSRAWGARLPVSAVAQADATFAAFSLS